MFNNTISKKIPILSLVALAVTFLLVSTGPAAAQAANLGAMICNAKANTGPFFGPVLSAIAYIAGCFFVVQGIYHLRGHTESPQNYPMYKALMLLGGGALLLVLPATVSTIITSLYTTAAGGGVAACTPGAVTGGPGLDAMMASFVGNIKAPIETFVSSVAIACGLFMIVRGLVKASKYGFDAKTNSVNSIVSCIVFGAILMTVGTNLGYILTSLFGAPTVTTATQGTVLGWAFVAALGGGSAQFANGIAAALGFVQIIGVIAFVRGWLILKKSVDGNGQATLAQGITHIIGGVLAVNIYPFLLVMDQTFGTNLL
ncbi:MAG: hypothetical protein WCD70_00890 [Alphaproteobacteria bacterium]